MSEVKQRILYSFVAEVDITNKRIFSRSSHPEVFCTKSALNYLAELTGKQDLFLNKVAGYIPTTLLKQRFMHSCFSVNFLELFRKVLFSALANHSLWFNWTLENLTINYDLGKYLKILTIIIAFVENMNHVPRVIFKNYFLPSTYSDTMPWGQGWENILKFGLVLKQS